MKDDKKLAKQMYLGGLKVSDIADVLNINVNTLNHWVHKGSKHELPWADIADMPNEHEVAKVLEAEHTHVGDVISLGMDFLRKQIASMHLAEVTVSPDGLKKLAETLEVLSKIEKNTSSAQEVPKKAPSSDVINAKHPFFTDKA
jgi:phage FluMu protein gp41